MIRVNIPYLPNKNLGEAYNKFMETLPQDDWALFIDDDVFLRTQPHWYLICEQAINQVGKEAGLITATTNRIGCSVQRYSDAPKSDDISDHITYAARRFQEHGARLVDCNHAKLSGFFMLTHKEAWEAAGKFRNGFLGVDNNYCGKVKDAGYKTFVLPGLYVYHAYKREWKNEA